MLELKDVTYTIRRDGEEVPLVNGVSICVPKGHFMAIVGPSGCGKTTLLKTIAGLNPESDGDLFWEGRNLSKERDFTPTEIGYVPQFSIAYDTLTVDESIEAATRLRVGNADAEAIGARIDAERAAGMGVVVSCSALKHVYRDCLRKKVNGRVRFILLDGPRDLISQRMIGRKGHFMPQSLLDSQLATLEKPGPDEDAVILDISQTVPNLLVKAAQSVGLQS